MASRAELTAQYKRLVAEREKLTARYNFGEKNLFDQIQDLNAQIKATIDQINGFEETASSGQVVQDDQQARVENSTPINPTDTQLVVLENGRISTRPDTSSGTNALPSTTPGSSVNTGTDAPVRTISETQSTPPGGSGVDGNGNSPGLAYPINGFVSAAEGAFSGGNFTGVFGNSPRPGGIKGTGASSEDKGGPTGAGTSAVVTELNSINFTEKLVPQANILDQYSSYTYQASLYLMTKNDYQRMINTGQKSLSTAQLLVQSGGANSSSGERNSYFDLDYYIDRLELKSFIAGKGVRLAHNVKEVRMTVAEPNGISFIEKIDAAVQQFTNGGSQAKKKNLTAQVYLLVIRFYGYDDQGNIVRAAAVPGQTMSTAGTVSEKWYPLILSKINFKVASKLVEYDLEFKAPPYTINASSGRGSIPFNIELSGGTVKDILAGPVLYGAGQTAASANQTSATQARTGVNLTNTNAGGGRGGATTNQTTTPPPKADSANTTKKTIRQGLMAALNEYQQDLVKKSIYQYADVYNIEFALDSMASATIINPGLNKGATSMATPSTAADQKLGTKQSMDPKSRIEGATAGMQIVQFIDTLMRNSSYIRDQQLVVVDEKTGNNTNTGANVKNTAWYKIGFRAEAMMDKFDEKRNDYAYNITYTISPYKISQLNSPDFKVPTFNGTHKKYNYWFTGENTQVLSYEETLNSLYYVVLTGANLGGASSNSNELLKYQYQTASGQTTQGAEGRTLEPAANAADQLYSPGDLKECTMSIVGDPAWLQQGEAFVGLRKGASDYYSAFLDDGTINFDSQQILFEIGYNTSKDYDLGTGLMEVDRGKYNSTSQQDQELRTPGTTKASRIYIAKECTSEFAKGKFTQTLKGSLMVYYPPGKADGKPTTNQTGTTAVSAQNNGAAKPYVPPRSSVTNPAPTSSLAKGTQQILSPATQADNPSLTQLQSSPVYIQARRGGATPAAALEAAKSSFAAGTNNAANFAAPGIRTGTQLIVKDQ
jgi:hypothetical protein